eukprot:77573_1
MGRMVILLLEHWSAERFGGKRHGHGIYTKKNKWKFEGEYKDDERNGDGKKIWSNGNTFVGTLVGGKMHGHGIYTKPNGYKFEGEYKDGERNGDGKIIWSDGDTFVGTWDSSGKTFVGTFIGGKRHGHGIYTKKNKWKFEGEYKDDERNGDGKII